MFCSTFSSFSPLSSISFHSFHLLYPSSLFFLTMRPFPPSCHIPKTIPLFYPSVSPLPCCPLHPSPSPRHVGDNLLVETRNLSVPGHEYEKIFIISPHSALESPWKGSGWAWTCFPSLKSPQSLLLPSPLNPHPDLHLRCAMFLR